MHSIIIGPPAFNLSACDVLCAEDALRLKYDQGLAAVVRLNREGTRLLMAGFSDFGDALLARWLKSLT